MEGREAGDYDADVLFEQRPECHARTLPWATKEKTRKYRKDQCSLSIDSVEREGGGKSLRR